MLLKFFFIFVSVPFNGAIRMQDRSEERRRGDLPVSVPFNGAIRMQATPELTNGQNERSQVSVPFNGAIRMQGWPVGWLAWYRLVSVPFNGAIRMQAGIGGPGSRFG